jgi:L-fucose mutarotase
LNHAGERELKGVTVLKGISPLVSPELLLALYRMGHGDEIVLADAHFPGHTLNPLVIRADGVRIAPLLEAVLPLFAVDTYVPDPLVMMAPVEGDALDRELLLDYRAAIDRHAPGAPPVAYIERFKFYERAKSAFAVVQTGETRKYGNIILKKGVTPVA